MTSVSSAFRRAMLCTKSELRFKQSSLNHRTRNLRSVGNLQLSPYPLYRYAIVLLVFPLKVSRLFLLFSSNNIPLRGRYICAFNSARFSAYCRLMGQRSPNGPWRRARRGPSPYPAGVRWALLRCCGIPPPGWAGPAGRRS